MFPHLRRCLGTILFAASCGLAPDVEATQSVPAPATTQSTPSETSSPVERVATIGASATAGFGVYFWRIEDDRPVRDSTTLAKYLRAASGETIVVSDLGTGQFFMNPAGIGRMQVDRAIASEPDLVIGIDFIFWFCYGTVGPDARRMRTVEDRLAMLERGLEILGDITDAGIPLLVGDVPDMSAARGRILAASQVPDPRTRNLMNTRIRAWVAEHPEAELFSLDRLQRLLVSDEPIEVDGETLDELERALLVQKDRLHPTLGGLAVIVDSVVRRAREHPLLTGRMPEIDTGYAAGIRRLTGFPSLLDQLTIGDGETGSSSVPEPSSPGR